MTRKKETEEIVTAVADVVGEVEPTPSDMAKDLLVQFIATAKMRAEGLEHGKTMNVEVMHNLKALQDVVVCLHSIGVLKP